MYYQMNIRNFMDKPFDQKINQKNIISSLKNTYKNNAFSTFPYILRNYNSAKSIDKFNSGNCVALSMYLKKYLKKKYNVESFLIPATIPRKFGHKDYLNISHVSLAIPKNNNTIYIADPAFYFLNPIKMTLNDNKTFRIFSKNIYREEINMDPKDYVSIDRVLCETNQLDDNLILNEYQTIPKNTYYSKCFFCNDKSDIWNYYLVEILNPDRSISNFFSNIRHDPFIMTTSIDKNGICISDYHIKVESNSIVIKRNNETIERFYFEEILNNINKFKKTIKKYNLSKFFDEDLINGIINYIKDINTHKKNINITD